MKNNKGFAISIMLYAMILLIVTIFYIVLAIVKTRFNYSETMVDAATKFLDEHDESMGHGDRTGPLILFDPPTRGFSNDGIVTINIFDDNDGEGLDVDSIIIKGNNEIYYSKDKRVSGIVTEVTINPKRTHARFKIKVSSTIKLYVSVKDKKGNFAQTLPRYTDNSDITYSYQSYNVTSTGPRCTINGPYLKDNYKAGGNNTKVTEIDSYQQIIYEIVCKGENGIDAYLSTDDFKYVQTSSSAGSSNNNHIYVNSITVVNGYYKDTDGKYKQSTRVTILATGVYIPPSSNPFGCSSPLALELKNNVNIRDSMGNIAVLGSNNLNFNNYKVKVCFRQSQVLH